VAEGLYEFVISAESGRNLGKKTGSEAGFMAWIGYDIPESELKPLA
jgi:hypothetical protein